MSTGDYSALLKYVTSNSPHKRHTLTRCKVMQQVVSDTATFRVVNDPSLSVNVYAPKDTSMLCRPWAGGFDYITRLKNHGSPQFSSLNCSLYGMVSQTVSLSGISHSDLECGL